MSKRIVLVLLISIITITSYSQRRIKKVEVVEKGFNVQLRLKPLLNEVTLDGLSMKVTPVSADEFNDLFLGETFFDGKFEYSHYQDSRSSYFLKRKKRNKEKTDIDFLLEGVKWLNDNEIINQEEYDELSKQIYFYYDDEAGKEIFNADKIILANPFYIGNKYLNVFKLEITNLTNSFKSLEPKFCFEIGKENLVPLTDSDIIDLLIYSELLNTSKVQSLLRHNMPSSLMISPHANFEKILAILPINYNNLELQLSLTGSDKKFSWQIEKEENAINRLYKYFEFDVVTTYNNYTTSSGVNFNYVKSDDSKIYFDNNQLFIDENYLSESYEIFTLGLYNDKLYYSRHSFKGADLIDANKGRRTPLRITALLIEELTKKTK